MATNFMATMPTECDCCGEKVPYFSDKNEWCGKYLKDDEEKVCFNCIKGRDGYAEEFLEKFGIALWEWR